MLEAAARVGIISQPNWHSCDDWRRVLADRSYSSASVPAAWTR
ncbi:MAG: hypothetical protein R3C56_39585 [Pirellulaceae bacterium]